MPTDLMLALFVPLVVGILGAVAAMILDRVH